MFSQTEIQKNRISYLWRRANKIVVIGHRKPDADSLGSLIGLGLILRKQGKEVWFLGLDEVPEKFGFIPQMSEVGKMADNLSTVKESDLIVTVDCGSMSMAGLDQFFEESDLGELINIDHHHDNDRFGDLNLIYPQASSTAEIIYEISTYMGVAIDREIATCLLLGILGDTDGFKNPNTTTKSLKITSELLSRGVSLDRVAKNILQGKSLTTLRLWGKVLSGITRNRRYGVVTAVVTAQDLEESEAGMEDLEGVANFLNCIPEARASMVLVEKQEGGIKGSLRTMSDRVDVSKLAAMLGGGGHRRAAGFLVSGKLYRQAGKWRVGLA